MRQATQNHRIVIAGAGYAGLHAALRLATRLHDRPGVELTLIDRHHYHQALTELPRVAAGTRAADAVRIPLRRVVRERVRFLETEVIGFDLQDQVLQTKDGHIRPEDRIGRRSNVGKGCRIWVTRSRSFLPRT